MTSTRALSKTETAHVRRRLQLLLEQYKTQSALERALDVSQQSISKILGGGAAGLYAAKKIAALQNIPVEQVLSAPQPGIDAAIAAHADNHWSPVTVAAVRAMPNADEADIELAITMLDKTEAALAPVRREWAKLSRER